MNRALKTSARAGFLVALTLLAVGCGDETRAIPTVTGEDSDVYEAYERLSAAEFKVEITDDFRTGPSCQCENALIEQWPPAGTRAKSGSTVELTVGGPGPVRSDGVRAAPPYRQLDLPNFVGLRLDSVDGWLAAHDMGWSADLPPLPATKGKDLLDAYVVSAQEPKGGDYVESGDSVDLDAVPTKANQWREKTVVVPHVNGNRSLVTAYDRLHARGLAVATDRPLSHGPYIRVVGQRPSAGTEVERGTTVTLMLDPKFDTRRVCCDSRSLPMPNFVGRNLGDVSEWLFKRGLYWKLVDTPALPPTNRPHMLDPYVVTGQEPPVGTRIPESIPRGSGDLQPIELRAKLVAG